MAKHRRRRRNYSDVVGVTLNGLGIKGSVDLKDAAVGLGIGVAGAGAAKFALKQFPQMAGMLPGPLAGYVAELGAAGAGVAAYFLKKKSGKGKAYLAGALGFAAASAAWKLLQMAAPQQFAGIVAVRLNGHDYGVMVDDSSFPALAMNGFVVDDDSGPAMDQTSANLAELAAASMGDDTDDPFVDGLEQLGVM